MNETYRNLIANAGANVITHIGLVDQAGDELSGGSPAYARQPVSWTAAVDGFVSPTADLVFNVPANTTVAGWSGFSADMGGTPYGGEDLTQEHFNGQGEFTLLAAGTGIAHDAGA